MKAERIHSEHNNQFYVVYTDNRDEALETVRDKVHPVPQRFDELSIYAHLTKGYTLWGYTLTQDGFVVQFTKGSLGS